MNNPENAATLPALTKAEVASFLEVEAPELYQLLRAMESREHWVLAEGEDVAVVDGLEMALPRLNELYSIEQMDVTEQATVLATLIGYLGASQFVLFLMKADGLYNGIVELFIKALNLNANKEMTVFADLFLERLMFIQQNDLRKQIFSRARSANITYVIQHVMEVRGEVADA